MLLYPLCRLDCIDARILIGVTEWSRVNFNSRQPNASNKAARVGALDYIYILLKLTLLVCVVECPR